MELPAYPTARTKAGGGALRLLLVRHGESYSNAHPTAAALPEREGDRLTPRGREQAEALARWLRAGQDMGAARLVTSPMLRARQTADPIARELGLEPHVCSAIHELREAVDYANLSPEEQKLRRWSVRMQESANDPDQAPEGRESFNGVLARVRQFKAELESWRVEGPVIAVSHGIYSRFFLFDSLLGGRFEAQQVERLWQLRTANCGISVFERDERQHPTDPETREWVCATWMARPWASKLVASSS